MKTFFLIFVLSIIPVISQINPDSTGWVKNGELLEQKIKIGSFNWIEYSKNGDTIFTFSSDNYFRKWDNLTGRLINEYNLNTFIKSNISDIEFSPKNQLLGFGFGNNYNVSNSSLIYMNSNKIVFSQSNSVNTYGKSGLYSHSSILFNEEENSFFNLNSDQSGSANAFLITSGRLTKYQISDNSKIKERFVDNPVWLKKNNNLLISKGGFYIYHFNPKDPSSGSYTAKLYKLDSLEYEFRLQENYLFAFFKINSNWIAGLGIDNYYDPVNTKKDFGNIVIYDVKNQLIINKDVKYNSSKDTNFIDLEVNFDNSLFTAITYGAKGKNLSLINTSTGELVKAYSLPDSVSKVSPSFTRNEAVLAGYDGILRKFSFKEVKVMLNANFISNRLIAYQNDTLKFINTTFSYKFNWLWNFGDNKYSVEYEPIHAYKSTGYFNVSLKISDSLNNSDEKFNKNYINIIDKPIANFIKDKESGYAPLTVKFTNHSDGYKISQIWYYMNTTSNSISPSLTFTNPGKYYITLAVKDSLGTEVRKTDSILVLDPTSVENNWGQQSIFNIFPNPSQEYINIELLHNLSMNQVKIYNNIGDEVYSSENASNRIDISNLNNGIYFIRIKANENFYVKNFVVGK